MAKNRKPPAKVFLNVPYDDKFENLFLAYIAGITAFGLVPRATLEIPGSSRRLDKIVGLINSCRYSIHDLSRVELDPHAPRTPRFNMPFELGLAVARRTNAIGGRHQWFVCEARRQRLQKSLSDLNGTDAYIHDGTIAGVLRELCNIFARRDRQPSAQQMRQICREMTRSLPQILRRSGAKSPYTASAFKDLTIVANACAVQFVH